MPFANAKRLPRPLLLLAFGFMLQMCANNSGENTPAAATSSTTGGAPDGGSCSVASDCGLPPSRCSADRAAVLYYTSPSCTNGTCRWVQQQLTCACDNGGCIGGAAPAAVVSTVNTAGPGVGGWAGTNVISTVNTAGPAGGWGGLGGQGGVGGLGDFDASDDAESSVADADAMEAAPDATTCRDDARFCSDVTDR